MSKYAEELLAESRQTAVKRPTANASFACLTGEVKNSD